MKTRTKERAQFLSDTLIGAIEHAGYGFPGIIEYKPEPDGDPFRSYAVIYDRYEVDENSDDAPEQTWRIDIDTMAKGFGIVRKMAARPEGIADWVREVIAADRTNGDDGDMDVVGALLVLECALFGKAMYA
jgi:hypothetical protein